MHPSRLTWLQAALLAVVLLASVALPAWLALHDPVAAFLAPGDDDHWIGFPFPVSARTMRTPHPAPPYVFLRRFALGAAPRHARLEVEALRQVEVTLNGEPLPAAAREDWREPLRWEVSDRLRAGTNEIRAVVRNPSGPPLLRVRLRGAGLDLRTDERWIVPSEGGQAVRARPADDTRAHPAVRPLRDVGDAAGDHALALAALFCVGTALAFAADGRVPRRWRRRAPWIAVGLVSAGWLAAFATRLAWLPLRIGFDVHGHLDYLAFVRDRLALPLATDGWSMFHPPLFYVLGAGWTALLGVEIGDPGAAWAHRLLPFAAGLGTVWVVWWAARRLFVDDPLRVALAVGVAGLLPAHLYMATYVSNETTAALATSAVLALALALLLADRVSARGLAGLALLGGLALLAKYSALLPVGIALAAVAARGPVVEGQPLSRAIGAGAGLVAGVAAVAGWYYLRNQLQLGEPMPLNWDVPPPSKLESPGRWWQIPGFHTVDYFVRFGESLRQPVFAIFRSYADGVYSTLWGDGLVAGHPDPRANPGGWALDWMRLAHPLALPATLLAGAGVVRGAIRAVRAGDPRRRLAWTFLVLELWAMALAHLAVAIRYPSYVTPKAFYALPVLLPFALVTAYGLAWLPERLAGPRWRPVRAVYLGWLFVLAAVLVRSFAGGGDGP